MANFLTNMLGGTRPNSEFFEFPKDETDVVQKCGALIWQKLGKKIISQESDAGAYTEANNNRFSSIAVLSPKYIVMCESTEDVATAVDLLRCGYHNKEGLPACPFAVKSGGHMAHRGANNIDGGITLDLSRINDVTLHEDKTVVTLGCGQSWRNVSLALNGTGVAVGGGRCADTGVGGVTLGGGISFFSPKFGLVADNVLKYEIVLASGQVVEATADNKYSDLFRALKGGAQNFGIITHIDIKTTNLPHFWLGTVIRPADDENTQIALNQLHIVASDHSAFPDSSFGTLFVFSGVSPMGPEIIWNSLTHFGESLSTMPESEDKWTLPFKDIMSELDFPTVLAGGDPVWPRNHRYLIVGVSYITDPEVNAGVHEINKDCYNSVKHIEGLEWISAYEPLPYLSTDESGKRINMLGLERKEKDLILFQIFPRWTRAEDDEIVRDACKRAVTRMSEYTVSKGKGEKFLYLNYSEGWQDPLSSYGEESVAYLHKVAAKYDPDRVFQTACKGGFKLPPRSAEQLAKYS